jgi:hypothetical protein
MFSTLNREGKGSKTNLSGFMAVLRIPETSRFKLLFMPNNLKRTTLRVPLALLMVQVPLAPFNPRHRHQTTLARADGSLSVSFN